MSEPQEPPKAQLRPDTPVQLPIITIEGPPETPGHFVPLPKQGPRYLLPSLAPRVHGMNPRVLTFEPKMPPSIRCNACNTVLAGPPVEMPYRNWNAQYKNETVNKAYRTLRHCWNDWGSVSFPSQENCLLTIQARIEGAARFKEHAIRFQWPHVDPEEFPREGIKVWLREQVFIIFLAEGVVRISEGPNGAIKFQGRDGPHSFNELLHTISRLEPESQRWRLLKVVADVTTDPTMLFAIEEVIEKQKREIWEQNARAWRLANSRRRLSE